jgi:excisionase family DNA binding protein
MSELYSAEEAAQVLGLQVRTVRNYVREGRLPGVRIGKQYRIARADLEAFTAGGLGRDELLASVGQPEPAAPAVQSAAEVSSVVLLDRIAPDACERLDRTLTAVVLAGATPAGPVLRVEPLYDEERRRLKVVIVGPLTEVADVLRILDAFTRERGSPGASSGSAPLLG